RPGRHREPPVAGQRPRARELRQARQHHGRRGPDHRRGPGPAGRCRGGRSLAAPGPGGCGAAGDHARHGEGRRQRHARGGTSRREPAHALHAAQSLRNALAMNPKLRTRLLVVAIAAAVTAGCAQDDPGQLLQDANAAFAKGEFRTAEIHLKNLLQEQSENVDARLLLAKTYAAGRNWPLAEKEFRRALELGASVDAVGPGLLEAMFESRDFEGVIEQASKLEPKQPEAQAEVAVWAGRAWLQQGDAERARQAFQQALAARPSLAKAKVGLLTVQAGEGDEARARAHEYLNVILADAPDSHEALMLQAQLRFASGDLDGAREPLETVVAATPSDLVARSTLVAIDLQRKDGEAAKTHL